MVEQRERDMFKGMYQFMFRGLCQLCCRPMSEKELGVVVNQVRRYLSTSFIRAQSLCLINRLSYPGEGAQAAAGRRVVARQLEEGRRRDRQAVYMAHIRGRGLSREGQIFV